MTGNVDLSKGLDTFGDAALTGALNGAAGKQGNQVLDAVNKRIDEDINAQVRNLGTKKEGLTHIQRVYQQAKEKWGDEDFARNQAKIVALTAAAAVTERLRVGTGIALVAQRDPIVTAKSVASLDLVSGGRFVFGIGFGWNVEELADHGVAFADRRAVVKERVEAQELGRRVHFGLDHVLRDTRVLEAERHILVDRHVRVQRIGLKDHRQSTICGADVVGARAVDDQIAR